MVYNTLPKLNILIMLERAADFEIKTRADKKSCFQQSYVFLLNQPVTNFLQKISSSSFTGKVYIKL